MHVVLLKALQGVMKKKIPRKTADQPAKLVASAADYGSRFVYG